MSDNPFLEEIVKPPSNTFLNILQTLVILFSIAILLYLFVITPNQVDGPSMKDNFLNGELVLTNRLSAWIGDTALGKTLGLNYKRGDVVILQKPGYSEFIKRIIALPGERISIRNGNFYIDGKKLDEEYIPATMQTNGGNFIEDGGEGKTVPEGYYFVSGDNRPVSNDSRFEEIGFIDRKWIKGKVILRFWPLNTFSLITEGSYSLQN